MDIRSLMNGSSMFLSRCQCYLLSQRFVSGIPRNILEVGGVGKRV
jgi:hypothetical protein